MTGRNIIVTGASSGIGKELCLKLVREGATVYGLCRRVEDLPEALKAVKCDLSDVSQIQHAFSQLPDMDAIVNNAGVAYQSPITEGKIEEWDRMWQVNVRALAVCSHLALPKLSKNGNIVNVSSMSGHRVPPSGGFYAPTKYAVKGVTEALRAELRAMGSLVRVSSISPGFVDTPLLDSYFLGQEDQLENAKKSMRMLTSEDVATLIMNILSSPIHVEIGDIQLRSVDQKI